MAEDVSVTKVDLTSVTPAPQLVVGDGEGITNPQQFVIDKLTLYLNDGTTFNLFPSLIELNIYEDLFSPTMTGHCMINDASGFIETLNITAFDFIEISFNKINQDDPETFTRVFRVYKIGDRFQHSRQLEQYPIYFCSEELMLNEQIKVAQAFQNQRVDQIIYNILFNSSPGLGVPLDKIGTIEETKNLYNFIVPNLKPFEAINWLSTYAQPAGIEAQSADMLFFQDKYGYNFRSLQSIMKDDLYATYNYSPQNVKGSSLNYDFNAMLAYKIIRSFDALKMINGGGYANKLITIDPLLRTSKSTKFSYNDYFPDTESLGDYPITNGYKNRFDQTVSDASESVFKVAAGNKDEQKYIQDNNLTSTFTDAETGDVVDSLTYDIGIETYVPYRTAQLTLINHTKVEFTVPGDPSLTVGAIVCLNIPSGVNDPSILEPQLDVYYSGNYMVTAVRHKLDVTGSYQCIAEAVLDSVNQDYIGSGGAIDDLKNQ